jgi:hypothetical protein
LFDSREALEEGVNRLYKHFARFGLKKYIRHEGGKSKNGGGVHLTEPNRRRREFVRTKS